MKRDACWYRKFRDMKLAQKMIAVYMLILGVCLIFCIAALRVSFNIYDGKLYEKSLQELDFFTQQVNRNLEQVEDLSYYIAVDTKMQERLAAMKGMRQFTAEYSSALYELRMMLNNEMSNTDMISNITYTDGGTTTVQVGVYTGLPDDSRKEAVLNGFHDAKGAYVIYPPDADYPYLLSGRDIRKHIDASLEYLGTLMITCDVAGMIEKNIQSLEAESAALCVYTDNGLVYESREGMIKEIPVLTGEKGYQIVNAEGQRYFLCHLKSSKTGWTYVNMFPYSEIYGQNQKLRNMVILGFLVLFFASAMALKKLSHMIVKPLEQLTESMQMAEHADFKGAREFLEQEERKDEIGLLTQEFRVSMEKIDNLIHENYEKQILLKDTKYRMLQAQINPHFLYNTLNSINWMVRAGKNKEAAEMTVALGDILRAALGRNQYFRMQEELYILKKYMMIQEYRYQKRVTFHMEADEELDKCLIPHMTLQPLVENAIYHCVEKMLEPCDISVEVRAEGNHIRLMVTDNGPGMTAKDLEAVRSFTARTTGHGIGLKNIYERLKMAFEQEASFEIDSAPGEGTQIRIMIPRREENFDVQGDSGR